MFKKLQLLICFIIAISIVSCGFHLRGYSTSSSNYKLPFPIVYVECNNLAICDNFASLIIKQNLAEIESVPGINSVIIRLQNEETSRDANGFNAAGRISSYLLSYQIVAQVWKSGEQIGSDIVVQSSASMNYNDTLILSKDQEEAAVWQRLHQDVENQLIRRLIALNKK